MFDPGLSADSGHELLILAANIFTHAHRWRNVAIDEDPGVQTVAVASLVYQDQR